MGSVLSRSELDPMYHTVRTQSGLSPCGSCFGWRLYLLSLNNICQLNYQTRPMLTFQLASLWIDTTHWGKKHIPPSESLTLIKWLFDWGVDKMCRDFFLSQVDVDYIEDSISISSYPLSAALTCAKICSAFEEKWNVVWPWLSRSFHCDTQEGVRRPIM